MVQRVVYNNCFGGFGLREEVVEWVRENEDELLEQYDKSDVTELADSTLSGEMFPDGSGPKKDYHKTVADFYISRDNELLADIVSVEIRTVQKIGGQHSDLRVAEVPDGVNWTIDEYDGKERVEEVSRTFS